jgi:large subunit ribosomal protein L1
MQLKEALAELRKGKKRKFDQTVDLLVSLKGIDLRRDNVSLVATIPHKIKEKKICGFLENKSDLVHTITKAEFDKYKDKAALKHLITSYDFFIASAKLMPSVATTFGKALGPAGKMPSPQLGVLMQETPEAIKQTVERIAKSVKIRAKEPSVKVAIGRESMSDDHISDNIKAVFRDVIAALPAQKENVRKVMIKSTMGAPIVVEGL